MDSLFRYEEHKCIKVLAALASLFLTALAGFLLYESIRFTGVNAVGEERVELLSDAPRMRILQLFVFALILFACSILGRILRLRLGEAGFRVAARRGIRILTAAVLILVPLTCEIWLRMTDQGLLPDDTGICWSTAMQFAEGDYSMLEHLGYLARYPQQLGIVALDELLLRLFGQEGYGVFFRINALFYVFLILGGTRLTALLAGEERRTSAEGIWLLLCLCNLPLFFYVNYQYGEVASAMGLVLTAWAVAEFEHAERIRDRVLCCAAGFAALAVGVLLRRNTVLVVIAAVAVLLLEALAKRRLRNLVLAGVLVLAAFLPFFLLSEYYAARSGVRTQEGMSPYLHITMGLEDDWNGPGWYTNRNQEIYFAYDGDREICEQVAKDRIRQQLSDLRQDPAAARDFLKRKLLTQWAEPSYDSLFCTFHPKGDGSGGDAFAESLTREPRSGRLWSFLNSYQALVYFGFLLYACGAATALLRRKGWEAYTPLKWTAGILLLGGFAFSILWEAKSRYIVEYETLMLPLAAVGLAGLTGIFGRLLGGAEETGAGGSHDGSGAGRRGGYGGADPGKRGGSGGRGNGAGTAGNRRTGNPRNRKERK
ncbi:MAG: hypothetical protein K6E92_08630 [Lachnospiraceae bacterium]|nr:hypothetical protein [Lachnospiraceae bacterium]